MQKQIILQKIIMKNWIAVIHKTQIIQMQCVLEKQEDTDIIIFITQNLKLSCKQIIIKTKTKM